MQLELPGTVRGEDFFWMRVAAVIPRLAANLIKESRIAVCGSVCVVKQLRVLSVFWQCLRQVTRSKHHVEFGDGNRAAVRRLQDVMAAEH